MKTIAQSMVLGIALLSPAVYAAEPPATRPVVQPFHQGVGNQLFGATEAEQTYQLSLPAGSSVAELLQYIQDRTPGFQYITEPGPWQDARLPRIELKAVTLGQILGILMELQPSVRVAPIRGGPNNVYVVSSPANQPASSAAPTEMSAFGLADPVERIGLKNAWAGIDVDKSHAVDAPTPEQIAAGRKKALQEVLSLLEAAASQADPDVPARLKLHEQTEVLLVRGTASQIKAISEALNALQSAAGLSQYSRNYRHLSDLYATARATINTLQFELNDERKAKNTLDHETAELQRENASLKRQLQQTGKADGQDKH